MKSININELPSDVQAQVRSSLTVYNTTYVTRENGQYTHSVGVWIDNSKKAEDFAFYQIEASDVYTEEERAEHIKALNEMHSHQSDSFWA